MTKSYTVEEAGARLPELLAEAASHVVPITQGGKAVAFLVTTAHWETLEIMANPAAMEAIRKDRAGEGTYYTLEDLDTIFGPLDADEAGV